MKLGCKQLFKLGVLAQAVAFALQANAQTELEPTTISGENQTEFNNAQILDAEQIEREVIYNITDTVRHIPGVQVNDTGDRFNDSGFNIRGVEADAIAITVDGVHQGETLSPPGFAPYGMFGANRNVIELETVKAIEIVKGPNSINAGSGALGGSVEYTTRDPGDYLSDDRNFAGDFKTGYDSRSDEALLSGALAGRVSDLETLLILTRRDRNETEAYGDGADIVGPERGLADPYDIESDNILAKLAYNITDEQRIGVVYEQHDRDTTGTPLSRESDAYYDFATTDTFERDRIGVFYEVRNADNPLFTDLDVTFDRQEIFSRGQTAFAFDADGDPVNDILRIEDRSYRQESDNLAIDLLKTVVLGNMVHDFNYGLSYQVGDVENVLYDDRYATTSRSSERTQHDRDPSWVPNTERTVVSLYFQDTVQITERLSLNPGARYDSTKYEPALDDAFTDEVGNVSDAEFTATVLQLAANYELAPGHSLIAGIGQGYKAPTTQQLYLDSNGGVADGLVDITTGNTFDDWDVAVNPDLEAEESVNYELSYLWKSDQVRLKLTYFSTDYDNLIQNVTRERPLGQTIETPPICGRFGCTPGITTDVDEYSRAENSGRVSVDGLELEAKYAVNENFSVSLAYSTVDGEHKTSLAGQHNAGDDLVTVSPDNAVLGANFTADDRRWGVSAYLSWTDEKKESTQLSYTSLNNEAGPAIFTDSYTVLNLTGYYNVTEKLLLTAAINNLTDKEYIRWEVVNSVRPGDGGFFSGVRGDGIERFTEPGRNATVNLTYRF